MQYIVQCNAVQCSAVQCSAVQCSAVQCSAVQCSAVQCSAVQCSAVQCIVCTHERECISSVYVCECVCVHESGSAEMRVGCAEQYNHLGIISSESVAHEKFCQRKVSHLKFSLRSENAAKVTEIF